MHYSGDEQATSLPAVCKRLLLPKLSKEVRLFSRFHSLLVDWASPFAAGGASGAAPLSAPASLHGRLELRTSHFQMLNDSQ